MTTLAHLMISGLVNGSLYVLLTLGLVLVYQVSGVINFAQGALAAAGAYLTWHLSSNVGLSFWLAAALALAIMFVAGLLLQVLLLKPLRKAPVALSLIVTLSLVSIIEDAIGQNWGFGSVLFVMPISGAPFRVGGVLVSRIDALTIAVAVVLTAAFFGAVRWTPAGLMLRAVAQSTSGAQLVGIRVGRVVLVAWGLSTALAAVAGILIAGQSFIITPSMADLYLLSAFAGAVIGGMDSLAGAALSALLIGVVQNLVAFYVSNLWHDAIVFLLLLAVLLLRPAGLFGHAVQRRV